MNTFPHHHRPHRKHALPGLATFVIVVSAWAIGAGLIVLVVWLSQA